MKKEITLFRIEHPDDQQGVFCSKKGLYHDGRSHSQYKSIIRRHHDQYSYPTYQCDRGLKYQIDLDKYNPNAKFAFNNQAKMLEAFKDYELSEFINRFGFKVYAIRTCHWFRSKHQAIYLASEVIEKIEITGQYKGERRKDELVKDQDITGSEYTTTGYDPASCTVVLSNNNLRESFT